MKYAQVSGGVVTGIVNWDGREKHPYGDMELVGPVPDETGADWVGKSVAELKPPQKGKVGHADARTKAAAST